MEAIDPARYLLLDDYLDLAGVRVSDWGPAAQVWTVEGGPSADEILAAVAAMPESTAWKKGEGPPRYRFDDHKRIPDVTIEASLGWMISQRSYYERMLVEGGPRALDLVEAEPELTGRDQGVDEAESGPRGEVAFGDAAQGRTGVFEPFEGSGPPSKVPF